MHDGFVPSTTTRHVVPAHNQQQRLGEYFPVFAQKVEAVIHDLEEEHFRPRIQDAHRSIEDHCKTLPQHNYLLNLRSLEVTIAMRTRKRALRLT